MKKWIFLAISIFAAQAFAQISSESKGSTDSSIVIKLGEGKAKKSLVAMPSLQFRGNPSVNPAFQKTGTEIYQTIQNDLTASTYFQFIDPKAFLEDAAQTSLKPSTAEAGGFNVEKWKEIGTEFLIRGAFSIAGDQVNLEIYAYSMPDAKLILGKMYKGPISADRRIAHKFANDLFEAMTGKEGMFLSRVVVASDRVGGSNREIYVMDWDGTNLEKITNHRSITLSPAWSHDGTKVAYTAFVQRAKTKTRNADLFVYEFKTGKRWLMSYRQGMNSGAAFTPDGKNILVTLSQAGSPDIYKLNMEGEIVERITKGPLGAMNVEPAISPDGKTIAFSTDRSGKPMLYTMGADGSNPKRLTFGGVYNATPSWSPDGKKIAFAGWGADHFDIFVMDADGANMVRLTSAKKSDGSWARNEDPTFSPDGRLVMYTSNRTGKNQIYISNLDGTEERRITNDSYNYIKPKWSKNIE